MGTPYLGEIRMVSFNFAPRNWALCNGQTMQIFQYQALFGLLGTTFGGDGKTNFMLPDFRGRTPIEPGAQPGGSPYQWGQRAGEEAHILKTDEMGQHTHTAVASDANPTTASPVGNFWASGVIQYSTAGINTALAANAIANAGSGQGHENRSPYLVVNFIIALNGIFPTRS